MEGKKISFGFMKTKKVEKPLVIINNDEKKEYIECVEEQSIKIVGGEEVKSNEPLIIPMKPNTLITPQRLKEIAEKVESAIEEPAIKTEPNIDENINNTPAENETIDQMVVRELMQEAKKEIKTESTAVAIPTLVKTLSEGEKESTLEDYEAVPIQEFGVALLRGMGWTPNKDSPKYKQPEVRPKGLGLGADKVIKQKKTQTSNDKAEELAIVKNAFVKITTGKYANCYGKVVSLDEDNGRVMVEIPVKKEMVSLSEFMMHAVSRSEYDRESKVINTDSYEEYKRRELSHKTTKQENSSSSDRRVDKMKEDRDRQIETNNKREKDSDSANGRSRNQRRDSSSSEDRLKKKKKDRRRYSSSDSLNSLSEEDKRPHKQNKHKKSTRRKIGRAHV